MKLPTLALFWIYQGAVARDSDFFYQQSIAREIATFVIFVCLVAWGISIISSSFKRHQQNSMQKQLLAKFSTAHDFAEFLQSPAGQKYVMNFSEAVTDPRNNILNALRIGIILVFLGVGCFSAGPHWIVVIGWVVLFLGFGFIVSSGISYRIHKGMKSEKDV